MVAAERRRKIPNECSVHDVSVIVSQDPIIPAKTEWVLSGARTGAIIRVPIASPKHFTERIVNQESDWPRLLLPTHLK